MQRNGSAKILRRREDLEEHAYKKCAQGTRGGTRNEQGGVRTESLRHRLASVTTSPPSLSFQFCNAEVLRFNLAIAAAHVCAKTTPRAKASLTRIRFEN